MPTPTQLPAVAGIDVSYYQETIDWPAVAAAGIRYAFLKATEGASIVDRSFAKNRANAAHAGVLCGAYHFFTPSCSAAAQANLFLRTVGKLDPGDLPPVLDLEAPNLWTNVAPPQRIRIVTEWLEPVESALGTTPIIYLSPSFAMEILKNDPALARHPVWLAHYTQAAAPRIPEPWISWTFWQHTQGGHMSGISTPVDLNWFNGSLDDLRALTVPTAPVSTAAP